MKNIHILPTDKASRLLYNSTLKSFCIQKEIDGMFINDGKVSGANFWGLEKALNNGFQPHNIYITSNEEIKEGDWYFDNHVIIKATKFGLGNEYRPRTKKIILTTDQELIDDGVQAIDDEFLEWFVKNSSCERVEIRYTVDFNSKAVIIIPKEEPKQETLEEVVFKVPFDYHIKPKEVMDMCMKEQQNIILTWRLGYFIDMINSLPDDIEKNRILKSVFDNRDGELLLESYKSMKKHYEK